MKKLLLLILFQLFTVPAYSNEFVQGMTVQTFFHEDTSSGELQGCSLLYKTVGVDIGEGKDKPIALQGNIGLHRVDRKGDINMSFKVGMYKLPLMNDTLTPYHAFIRTQHYSTANVTQNTFVGDSGGRLYAYPVLSDSTMLSLLEEFIDNHIITVVFNTAKDTQDMSLVVDFSVNDIKLDAAGKWYPITSSYNMEKFNECFGRLLNIVETELKEPKNGK